MIEVGLILIIGLASEVVRGGTIETGSTQFARVIGALMMALVLIPHWEAMAAVVTLLFVGSLRGHSEGQHAGRSVPAPKKGWPYGNRPTRIEAFVYNVEVGFIRGALVDYPLFLTTGAIGVGVLWAIWRPVAYEIGWCISDFIGAKLERHQPHLCEWIYGPGAALALALVAGRL